LPNFKLQGITVANEEVAKLQKASKEISFGDVEITYNTAPNVVLYTIPEAVSFFIVELL
jgi:hypothetical protein